jgi:hypothetical protein
MALKVGGNAKPPFKVDEVVTVGSLAEALDRLVFNHPRVEVLRQQAISAMKAEGKPFYDNAGFMEPVYGHDELMLPLKMFAEKDYEKLSHDEYEAIALNSEWNELLPRWPKEHTLFRDELELRCFTLIGMLQHREIDGVCYTSGKGERESLLHTVWSRDDLYVHIRTGDLYEARRLRMIKRWVAVAFQLPGAAALPLEASNAVEQLPAPPTPPKRLTAPLISIDDLTRGEQSVHSAVVALWGGDIPSMLMGKQRDKQISDYLKAHPELLSDAAPSTIKRYLRKRKVSLTRQLALRKSES